MKFYDNISILVNNILLESKCYIYRCKSNKGLLCIRLLVDKFKKPFQTDRLYFYCQRTTKSISTIKKLETFTSINATVAVIQTLGADHLTLEGEGVGVGWFWKKFSCWRLLEEKNCMQHKWNRKKFLHCCKQEKKCCKAISSFLGALQNPSKTATIPDNLQASEPLWLAY